MSREQEARAKQDVADPPKRLIGVGVGPGDPELVTVKAVRVLREADLVFVPILAGAPEGPGRAGATVREHVDGANVRAVPFVLDDRGGRTESRLSAWDEAARAVVAGFEAGATSIAFATIGDPNIYSTFSYLAQTVRVLIPEVVVETVPGITAMQDLAARRIRATDPAAHGSLDHEDREPGPGVRRRPHDLHAHGHEQRA